MVTSSIDLSGNMATMGIDFSGIVGNRSCQGDICGGQEGQNNRFGEIHCGYSALKDDFEVEEGCYECWEGWR